MKHCIIVKFKDTLSEDEKSRIEKEAGDLFGSLLSQHGITAVNVYRNCIRQANRSDLMIVLDMPASSLPAYAESPEHKRWKAEYGASIESKAIFDYE